MEARLLDSLHHKLEDLETKIQAYRGDLIHDFQQHYHDLLLDVNPDVASTIQQAIISSFVNYPTLRPELEPATDSQPSPDGVDNPNLPTACRQASLPATSASTGTEPTESSREREDGLHGLFIPSYLPLLEGFPPKADSPTVGISIATMTAPPTEDPFSPSFPLDAGTGHKALVMDVLPDFGGTASSAPQEPVDINTGSGRTAIDDSTSSVCSDKSDSKVRRSALRRSSSLSKPPQSPRRVRFEFMGAEVLPTASPQSSEFSAFVASSPFPDDDSINSDTILDADLEDPETPPPPPKISSSDALRALSRAPVEDGTIWTVVNPDMEPGESQQQKIVNNLLMTHNAMEKIAGLRADEESGTSGVFNSSHVKWLHFEDTNHDSELDEGVDESSDDEGDYLAMVTPRSPRTAAASMASQSNTEETSDRYAVATGVATHVPNEVANSYEAKDHDLSDDEFDDDMFQFEPGGLTAPPKPRQMPPPEPEEISDDESNEIPLPDEMQTNRSPHEESPAAMSIAKPPKSDPIAPAVAKFRPASVGSYKGRPVVMPVVRDADLYARAASLGKFNTFVGGLDGRSGIDEGDLSSFRNSVVHTAFTGTPRSLTERFMMEEARSDRMRKDSTSPH